MKLKITNQASDTLESLPEDIRLLVKSRILALPETPIPDDAIHHDFYVLNVDGVLICYRLIDDEVKIAFIEEF